MRATSERNRHRARVVRRDETRRGVRRAQGGRPDRPAALDAAPAVRGGLGVRPVHRRLGVGRLGARRLHGEWEAALREG